MASIDDTKAGIGRVKDDAGRLILALLEVQGAINKVTADMRHIGQGSGRSDVAELIGTLEAASKNNTVTQDTLVEAMKQAAALIKVL